MTRCNSGAVLLPFQSSHCRSDITWASPRTPGASAHNSWSAVSMPTHRLTHPFPFKAHFSDPLAFLTRAQLRVRVLQFSLLPVPLSMPWRPEMKRPFIPSQFRLEGFSPLTPVLPPSPPPLHPHPASSACPTALLPLSQGDCKTGPSYFPTRLHIENAHEVILKSMGS